MKGKLVFGAITFAAIIAIVFSYFFFNKTDTKASNTKIVVFHYQRSDNEYDKWNVWLWDKDGADITSNIKVEGNIAIINGVSHLFSSNVEAKDLRGAAALLIAALKSHGTSTISNVELFLRGYDISKLIPKTIYKLEL